MHWQCIDFLIDLLVLVPFELSGYVLFIAESMESGVLEWATSPYTKWIVLAFMCSGYCWRTIFSINNINTFFKTWLRFRKLEWLMISVGIMLIPPPPPRFRFSPEMKHIIQMRTCGLCLYTCVCASEWIHQLFGKRFVNIQNCVLMTM